MSTDTFTRPVPGDKLDNGSTIIAIDDFRPGGDGMRPTAIVLALVSFGSGRSCSPYVTWEVSLDDRSAVSGHYFSDIVPAVEDFCQRARRDSKMQTEIL
jgi:hypothetical protein